MTYLSQVYDIAEFQKIQKNQSLRQKVTGVTYLPGALCQIFRIFGDRESQKRGGMRGMVGKHEEICQSRRDF